MIVNFSGTVLYMNGVPVPNVDVHILDKDAQGKQDDDLTVAPGQSDDQGHFTVSYEPMRFLDYHPPRPTHNFSSRPVSCRWRCR